MTYRLGILATACLRSIRCGLRTRSARITAVFLLAAALASTAVAEPLVRFERERVVVSGVVPKARVVFFAVALNPLGYESEVLRWATIVPDTDGDGIAALDLGREVPWKSLWVVADLTNNKYVVAAPAGFPTRLIALPPGAFRSRGGATADEFIRGGSFADVLYVTPAGGVWTLKALDGYESDTDGRTDGVITLAADTLESLDGAAEKTRNFLPGGLLFAFDISTMEVVAVRINEAVLRGGH